MPWLLCPTCREWTEPQHWDDLEDWSKRCPVCGHLSDPSDLEMRVGDRPTKAPENA